MFIKDIPRLHTALAEWMSCMILLSLVPRRLKGWRFGLAAGGALIVMYVWLESTRAFTSVFWMLAMAVAVGLMFLMMLLLGRMNAVTTAYCTIRAFLLAEFAASLEWQLYSFFHHSVELSHWMISLFSMAVVYAAVFSVSYFIERRAARGLPPPEMTWRELLSAVAVGVSAFLISNLSFVWSDTPFSSSIRQEIYNIRTLVDLAGVVALYAYHVRLYDLNSRRELDAIKNILQNQYVQYRQSRESIDLINRKYHDLKHQIAVLRAEQGTRRSGLPFWTRWRRRSSTMRPRTRRAIPCWTPCSPVRASTVLSTASSSPQWRTERRCTLWRWWISAPCSVICWITPSNMS